MAVVITSSMSKERFVRSSNQMVPATITPHTYTWMLLSHISCGHSLLLFFFRLHPVGNNSLVSVSRVPLMCRGLNFVVGGDGWWWLTGVASVVCKFLFFFLWGLEVMVGVYTLQTSSPPSSVLPCFLCLLLYKQKELMCSVHGIIFGHLKWGLFFGSLF